MIDKTRTYSRFLPRDETDHPSPAGSVSRESHARSPARELAPEGDPGVSAHERRNALELLRRHSERTATDPQSAAFRWIAQVGSAFRLARSKRAVGQDDVSQAAGITQGYLSNVENGKLVRGPTLDVLYRYANALECDCEFTLRDPATQKVIATVKASHVRKGTANSVEILQDDLRFAGREVSLDALAAEVGVAVQEGSDDKSEKALRKLEQSIAHDKG